MDFNPIGKPNIIVLSSATHPSIKKYGTINEKTGEYVITVRVTYGDVKGLKDELMKFVVNKVITSNGVRRLHLEEISNDIGKIFDFFDKSAKENLIFTKDDCMKVFPDLCEGDYENIMITTIIKKKNASSSVLREARKGPVEVKPCGYCGKAASLLCAKCKNVAYCDATCQRAHWPTHKAVCVKPEECAVPVAAAVRAPSARAPSAAASVPSVAASVPSAAARAPSAAASAPSAAAPSVEESFDSSLPGPNAAPSEGGRRKRRRKTLKKNKKGRHSRKA